MAVVDKLAGDISIRMVTKPLTDALENIEKRSDKATQYAVREIARRFKREARRRAPVYKNYVFNRETLRHEVSKSTMTAAQFKKFQKITGYRGSISNNVVISGLLKNSISSSRRLRSSKTGEYAVTVGPRGQRVHLYAQKIEAVQPYVKPAYDAVLPEMVAIHAKVWARVNDSAKK